MLYSGKQIVSTIKQHIKKRGGAYPTWVVGVSANARKQMFEGHGVRRKLDRWILMHAQSPTAARRVWAYLSTRLGIRAVTASDDKTADFVYVYRQMAHTKQ
jgi:hypothetical protein